MFYRSNWVEFSLPAGTLKLFLTDVTHETPRSSLTERHFAVAMTLMFKKTHYFKIVHELYYLDGINIDEAFGVCRAKKDRCEELNVLICRILYKGLFFIKLCYQGLIDSCIPPRICYVSKRSKTAFLSFFEETQDDLLSEDNHACAIHAIQREHTSDLNFEQAV